MSRHGSRPLFSIVIIVILVIPIIASFGQNTNEVDMETDRTNNIQLAETSATWHDDCSSTDGWISQNTSSGFDPKHPILESGTLSSTGGYLIVTGIADPVTERKGPLFIKELGDTVTIDAIEMFQAEVEFAYVSSEYGFLSVYLFDENKQKAVMLRLHDAWAASTSHPESVYFTPGEAGDGTVHDESFLGSWSGHLRFWYNESTGSVIGELDDGTPNRATLKTAGNFDPDRSIKYIGIQWSRAQGVAYGEDSYRLLDVQLTYDVSETSSNWLTGWNHRKSHEILGKTGAGVNYQVPIIVNFGTGTDSGNSVYCDSKCQPDFDDIRFTSSDGGTLLDYWRDSYVESDNATFWVEVKDNLDSNVTIFIYYGNTTCTTISNGTATFILFDDFETGTLERWDDDTGWSISDTYYTAGEYGAYSPGGATQSQLRHNMNQTEGFLISIDARTFDNFNTFPFLMSSDVGSCYPCTFGWTNVLYHTGTYSDWPQNSTVSYNTWYTMQIGFDMSLGKIRGWKNDSYMGEVDFASTTGETPSRILSFRPAGGTQTTRHLALDNVYIRKWVPLEPAHGSWSDTESWLSGWDYRKSHDINGASGAGENYQVEITVHYGYGTDSGTDVFCKQQCQSDFDDIRFTDNNGFTLLDYWTESIIDSDNATFWVEVKDDLSDNTTIHMYYGNSTVSTLSNGTATFIFFDDYENNNLDRWDGTTGAGYSCATDQVVHGTYALKFQNTPGADIIKNLTESGDAITHDFMVHTWVRDDNQLRGGHAPLVRSLSQNWVYACRGYNTQFSYFQGGSDYVHWPNNYTGASDTWFEMEVGLSMSTDAIHAWKSGSYMGSIGLVASNGVSVPDDLYQLGFGQQSAYVTWWDDTYVRKWVENEPTHGAWGEISEPPVQASINDVEDFGYEAGVSGNVIEWTIENFNPTSYELWRDGGLLVTEVWPGGSMIEVNIDNLSPGAYNYTIIVYGNNDVVVSDIVIITVTDTTSPSLGNPLDIIYEYDTTGHSIIWSVSDLYPNEYTIYLDEVYFANGTWTPGPIALDIDGLALGEYNYTIRINDTIGNSATNTVIVTVVDTNSPLINHPSDILGDIGETSIQITWQPTDLLPLSYVIYQNGTQISSGTWISGENLTYTLESLSVSSYNITIVVWDTSGNYATDTVFISIEEGSIPGIGDYMVIIISFGSLGVLVIIVGLICRNKGGPRQRSPSSYDW